MVFGLCAEGVNAGDWRLEDVETAGMDGELGEEVGGDKGGSSGGLGRRGRESASNGESGLLWLTALVNGHDFFSRNISERKESKDRPLTKHSFQPFKDIRVRDF